MPIRPENEAAPAGPQKRTQPHADGVSSSSVRETLFAGALARIGTLTAGELRALRPMLLVAQWRCLLTARRIVRELERAA